MNLTRSISDFPMRSMDQIRTSVDRARGLTWYLQGDGPRYTALTSLN